MHVQNLLVFNKLGDFFTKNGHILIGPIFSNRQSRSVSDKQICGLWSVNFFKEIPEVTLGSQKDLQLFTLAQIFQRGTLFQEQIQKVVPFLNNCVIFRTRCFLWRNGRNVEAGVSSYQHGSEVDKVLEATRAFNLPEGVFAEDWIRVVLANGLLN